MTTGVRVVIAAILCVALHTNEVTASSRLKIEAKVEVGVDNFGSGALGQLSSLGLLGTASEDQATKVLFQKLSSAETKAKDAAVNITKSAALEVLSKQHDPSAEMIKSLIQQEQPGYAGVQKGQDMLNQMIKEAMEKLDLERQTCYTFIISQVHQIWITVHDIRMFDARAAGAREDVLAAQTEIERLTQLLPVLTLTLKQHNEKCEEDIASLEAQLKIVRGDIEVMSNVLKLTECKASLLMTHAAKISSQAAQQLMQQGLDEACDGDDLPKEKFSWSGLPESPNGEALVQLSATPGVAEAPKQRAKCTLSKNSCKKLRDKFLQIQAGIESKREELMAELNAIRKHCADEKANLEAQISDAETDLKSWQTALAKATKEQNDAERNSKLKNEERLALIKELIRMFKLCRVNINNLISEGCALGRIRGELEQMKGHTNPAFLQDCEVTDWSAEECSVTCGGGNQKLTRAVSVHPVGGSECPPLEMSRTCNEDACPVDCETGDWSEWGDCSSECNGGVKQKIRSVISVAQNGGQACGETSVAESCNVQSCDVDCVLSDWSGWSICSKECDGGLESRVKNVVESAKGDGQCAKHDSDKRLEFMPCNTQGCTSQVTCTSKLDVVLLLDGSGSLRQSGWEQTKKFGQLFIKAMQGGPESVKLSVILFSGPRTWSMVRACTGVSTGATPSMAECGIQIVQHFTTDMAAAVNVVAGLNWPASTTLTSQALMAAKSELSLGRKDAQSVVIVVTDGRPMSSTRTAQASYELRESARLMWVPVTRYAPMKDIKSWASKPFSENIIKLDSFWEMTDLESIGNIVADMCPKLNQTGCSRPVGWCSHPGSDFAEEDCDGDGLADPQCTDNNGNVGYLGSAGNDCVDTWPNGDKQCKKA